MASTDSAPKKMKYVRLGQSGLKVSRIILGTMQYGHPEWQGGWTLGEEEGIKHIKAAYDLGIQTFDTADVYSNGVSEEILGKAIRQHNLPRDEIVVMTKLWGVVTRTQAERVGFGSGKPDELGYVNQHGLSRKHIFASVDHSLRRLQLDYIDVLQCHRVDEETPIEETMQALHDVVQSGKVRYVGMSSCFAWQFHRMQNYAINNKLTPFISMQNHYNLIYREEEREMVPTLKMFGVGSIPWSALARGVLTRSIDKTSARAAKDAYVGMYDTSNEATKAIVTRVEELSQKKGVSMAQISVAWLLSKDVLSAPIIGTTSLDNLRDIADGVHVTLSEDEIKHLEEPYKPQAIIGHW